MRAVRKKQSGFSFLELLISLGIISILAFTALQHEIEKTEMEVAEAFGMDVAMYSQAVASYIADEGVGMPSGTFTGFDWLKSASCGGSAPEDYLPCTWNPRLPFNIELETEVIYGTGVIGDPCSEPVGHVCAQTRLTVPATNGQERLDLAAEMLHATQGSSNSVRSTQQSFVLNDVGQVQVTVRGEQSPPTQFLRRDGVNTMQATLNMGDKNLYNVRDVTADGELEMARFIDRDDPAFVMDPDQLSVLQDVNAQGDLHAPAGGDLNANSIFNAGADIESVPTFDGEAFFHDLAEFIGGETNFNGTVESSRGTPAEFNEADSQDLADFHAGLEIVGTAAVGDSCNATIENMRFNGAGELLECVGGVWQYAGIETKKGTITYYSLASTNSYGEFFWAGDGIDIPGRHHICSAQSIEGANRALGGGAVIEATSGPDSLGRSSFQYLAAGGVEDAESIPLRLQSGERTVICLALGPEPVQATVSTTTNSAPSGSVSCTSGYVSEPFLSRLNVSDPDTPLLYTWSTSGRCSIVRANSTGDFSAEAWIQRSSSSGTCTVRAQVTDYYNATRTISSSCQVWPRPCPTVQGLCSCTGCHSGTNIDTTPPEPPGYDSRPPPDGSGPWDPTETWRCRASCGGSSDSCVEGSACSGPESGSCSGTINRCYRGNSTNYSAIRTLDQTTHRWTCRGINGGSDDSCEVVHDHTRPCDPATDRVNAVCGTNFGDCTAGNYEPASNQSWICRGICGGTDAECDAPNTNRVNGACGSTLNSCDVGTYQAVTGPTWNCLGNDPLLTDDDDGPCQPIVQDGLCGYDFAEDCEQGRLSGQGNEWQCLGPDDTDPGDDDSCAIGQCPTTSSTVDTCVVGTSEDISGDPDNAWWCRGSHPQSSFTDDDARCKPVIDGVCGQQDTPADRCISGEYEDEPGDNWWCRGINGGLDSDPCVPRDEFGQCNTGNDAADNASDGCTLGLYDDFDNGGPDWHCRGSDDTIETDDDLNCAPASCALSNFTWISSCGQGQIGCDGYYETNYDHCLVTNPVAGALYYQDAVGYGVDFLASTPPTPGGQFTVEYTCCTNCDDPGSPISNPDNDCSWPPVTPADPVACDFGSTDIDITVTPHAACVPASCAPGAWAPGNDINAFGVTWPQILHGCPDAGTCAAAGGNWTTLGGGRCDNASPQNPMWNGWTLTGASSPHGPHGVVEYDENVEQGEATWYCANTCEATAQSCARGGRWYAGSCENLHAAAMAGNAIVPSLNQALSQTPACHEYPDISSAGQTYCDGGLHSGIQNTTEGAEWRCHGAGFPTSSVDCGVCAPSKGYEGDWPNCTQVPVP